MSRSSRYALRLIAGIIGVGLLSMLLIPAPPAVSPYASALSTLSLGTDLLAAPCAHSYCAKLTFCVKSNTRIENCRQVTSNTCTEDPC
jgi:hypothetical protein